MPTRDGPDSRLGKLLLQKKLFPIRVDFFWIDIPNQTTLLQILKEALGRGYTPLLLLEKLPKSRIFRSIRASTIVYTVLWFLPSLVCLSNPFHLPPLCQSRESGTSIHLLFFSMDFWLISPGRVISIASCIPIGQGFPPFIAFAKSRISK